MPRRISRTLNVMSSPNGSRVAFRYAPDLRRVNWGECLDCLQLHDELLVDQQVEDHRPPAREVASQRTPPSLLGALGGLAVGNLGTYVQVRPLHEEQKVVRPPPWVILRT